MRQAGFLAAAGLYAVKNNIDRLATDHEHARLIADTISKKSFVNFVLPVETNIIIFELKQGLTAPQLVEQLKAQNILAYAIAPDRVRLVLHLDITPAMVSQTIEIFEKL